MNPAPPSAKVTFAVHMEISRYPWVTGRYPRLKLLILRSRMGRGVCDNRSAALIIHQLIILHLTRDTLLPSIRPHILAGLPAAPWHTGGGLLDLGEIP
jgi:hypothetical protein